MDLIHEVPCIGTRVLLRKTVEATVIGILIKNNKFIQYECSWWNGNQRLTDFTEAEEIYTFEATKLGKIGFICSTSDQQ